MKNVSRKISTPRRQAREHARVDHRGLDLALEVLLAGAEVGDLLEDDGQEPARLARADHRDVDAWRTPWATSPARRPATCRRRRRRGPSTRRASPPGCDASRRSRCSARDSGSPAASRLASSRVKLSTRRLRDARRRAACSRDRGWPRCRCRCACSSTETGDSPRPSTCVHRGGAVVGGERAAESGGPGGRARCRRTSAISLPPRRASRVTRRPRSRAPASSSFVLRITSSIVVRPSRDEAPAVLAQALHALLDGDLADLVRRRAVQDQRADLVGHRHHLEDALPAAVAGALAVAAAGAVVQHRRARGRRTPSRSFCVSASGISRLALACRSGARAAARRSTSTDDATRYGSTPMSISRVAAPGASFVCSVRKTRWPVSDACTAISAVSRSRISPTRTTSGSWRRIARRPAANVRPRLGVHLDLVDAAELVLDRVFDRDDLPLDVVDLRQRGVERRRLAGAGRAGDEDDAVRHVEDLVEVVAVALGHAEVLGAEHRVAAVEDAEHDRLAVDHRDDRDAHVDLAAGDLQLDAAVLREALLGDVEVARGS